MRQKKRWVGGEGEMEENGLYRFLQKQTEKDISIYRKICYNTNE